MISIVIPTYNSGKIIYKLCDEIQKNINKSDEIILINDCSTDNTLEVLGYLKVRYTNIKVINLKSNIGQVGATLLGIKISKGDFIITMDDDFQHDPIFISKLVNELKTSESKVVVAKWNLDETLTRNYGSLLFTILSSVVIFKKPNFRNTAYRAISCDVKDEFINFFISRFWLDPRRLKNKVHQISIGHNHQDFRPYSSFKSRIILASKHLAIDSYLIQFVMISLIFKSILHVLISIILATVVQFIIREAVKTNRMKIYKSSL